MKAHVLVGTVMLVGLLGFASGIVAGLGVMVTHAVGGEAEQFRASYSTAQLLAYISILLGFVGALASLTRSRAPSVLMFVSAVGISFPIWLLTRDGFSAWMLVPAGLFVLAGTLNLFNPRSTSNRLTSRVEIFALAVPVAFAVALIIYVPFLLTGREQDIERRGMTRDLFREHCPGTV